MTHDRPAARRAEASAGAEPVVSGADAGFTPAAALAAIESMLSGVEGMLASDDPEAIGEAALVFDDARAAYTIDSPADETDPGWLTVEPVMAAFVAWLEAETDDAEPVATRGGRHNGAPEARRKMTRDERVRIAVQVATRGRGRGGRRNDAIDKILDGMDAGAAFLARNLWKATKLVAKAAGKATLYVGEKLGQGIVHVAGYMRGGVEVGGYDRATPAKKGTTMPSIAIDDALFETRTEDGLENFFNAQMKFYDAYREMMPRVREVFNAWRGIMRPSDVPEAAAEIQDQAAALIGEFEALLGEAEAWDARFNSTPAALDPDGKDGSNFQLHIYRFEGLIRDLGVIASADLSGRRFTSGAAVEIRAGSRTAMDDAILEQINRARDSADAIVSAANAGGTDSDYAAASEKLLDIADGLVSVRDEIETSLGNDGVRPASLAVLDQMVSDIDEMTAAGTDGSKDKRELWGGDRKIGDLAYDGESNSDGTSGDGGGDQVHVSSYSRGGVEVGGYDRRNPGKKSGQSLRDLQPAV